MPLLDTDTLDQLLAFHEKKRQRRDRAHHHPRRSDRPERRRIIRDSEGNVLRIVEQ